MVTTRFIKGHGTGNDFVVVADPELPGYDEAVTSATIERIDAFLR